MTAIRIALVSAFALASLLAGGVAAAHHPASHPVHRLAGPELCCDASSQT
jgi:hypothetical protein